MNARVLNAVAFMPDNELITGSCAFRGDSTAQILSAVLRDPPRPFEVPPALQQ
jgi:hypothetical protein